MAITFLNAFEKTSSIPKVNRDKISVAIDTITVDDCKSAHFGHSTLYLNSWYDPFKNSTIEFILFFLHGNKDSNPDQRFWRPVSYHWTIPVVRKVPQATLRNFFILRFINLRFQ